MSISNLLAIAHSKLAAGEGSSALEIVMNVIRETSGDDAVMYALNLMRSKLAEMENADSALNSLCNRWEESCLIDDDYDDASRLVRILESQNTILLENGRTDILRDAFEDGSSIVCTRCGDLVARSRWRQHREQWCSAIQNDEEM